MPLKYDFILYFLAQRQSGTGRGYPSIGKLLIMDFLYQDKMVFDDPVQLQAREP